jgi:biotin/methionine sulfoxide reductase
LRLFSGVTVGESQYVRMKQRYSAAHWGVYEVEAGAAGAPPRLSSLSSDPDPNPIGLDQLDPSVTSLRISRPAIRKGWLDGGPGAAGERRGADPFVEVDWDVALDHVAAEITRIRDAHGPEALFVGSYGWASAGRFHHAQSQLRRFYHLIGGRVFSVDTYSLAAGAVIMPHVAGGTNGGSHSSWDVLAEHCELFVSFGGVPLKNGRTAFNGAGRHRVRGGLRRLREAGARIVNIGPVGDNLGDGDAHEWIPIRPNTDTAMMLALAWVVLHDPRFDRGFIDSHTVGFDRFVPYLTGETDGVAKTPEWAEAITGVPAAVTVRLAREMLGKRTTINAAYALQRAAHGEQPFWMIVVLAAMLGQIGLPGGGYGLGYGASNTIGSAHTAAPGPAVNLGANPVKAFIPVARVADMLLNPGGEFTYNGGVHRYPHARLVHWAGGNPFHHHQDLNRLRQAWARPETVIVNEQYWTPLARHADIVLPATITLERDDISQSPGEGVYVAMPRVVEPHAQARDDFAIFTALAERFQVAQAFTEGLDATAWIERLYSQNRAAVARAGIELPPFDAFWEQGLVELEAYDKPVVMHEGFRRDPAAHPLKTPSGKIEIFSERVASFGLKDCPGHPVWLEPFEWLGHAAAARHPIHLLSDQPERKLHSQLDHSPYSRAGKIATREPVTLNPADAAARGIADGDIVELFNDRGRCLAGAVLSDQIMPGVARLSTGAWYDPDLAGEGLERHGNPNVLTLDRGASGLSQGCSAQTCVVEIRRYEGPPPRMQAFDPPQLLT